jgi:protein-disulfide isomerase
LRKVARLLVIALIGSAILISAAAWADDWVQLPSSSDSSSSESTSSSHSQDSGSAGGHPQRGGDNAAVTIVEYSDFQCPYCREVESSLRQVLKKYGDQVRLVYMDFPLAFHQHAMDAAIAARCADEQGQFWPYHDALLESPSSLSTPALKTTAAELGLDPVTFGSCLDERKFEADVVADRTQAESIGAKGTPYFVVGSRSMSGAQQLSAFESVIDEQLRRR